MSGEFDLTIEQIIGISPAQILRQVLEIAMQGHRECDMREGEGCYAEMYGDGNEDEHVVLRAAQRILSSHSGPYDTLVEIHLAGGIAEARRGAGFVEILDFDVQANEERICTEAACADRCLERHTHT